MANNVTAVELSKDGFKVVTGYYYQDRIHVISSERGQPLNISENGEINEEEAVRSLSSLLAQNKENVHGEEGPYIVAFPPDEVGFVSGSSQTATVSHSITSLDYRNCLSILTKEVSQPESSIVSVIPYVFRDGNSLTYTSFPLGTPSNKLYLEADAVVIPKATYERYQKILARCRVFPYLRYISSFPPLSLIGRMVKDFPTYIALDIDSRFTYISLVKDKRLTEVKTINIGMDHIDAYVSKKLGATAKQVVEMRELFGFRCAENITYPYPDIRDVGKINRAFEQGLSLLTDEINNYVDSLRIEELPVILYGPSVDQNGLSEALGDQTGLDTFDFTQSIYGAFDQSYVGCLGMIYMSTLPYQLPQSEAKKLQREEEMKSVSISRK